MHCSKALGSYIRLAVAVSQLVFNFIFLLNLNESIFQSCETVETVNTTNQRHYQHGKWQIWRHKYYVVGKGTRHQRTSSTNNTVRPNTWQRFSRLDMTEQLQYKLMLMTGQFKKTSCDLARIWQVWLQQEALFKNYSTSNLAKYHQCMKLLNCSKLERHPAELIRG